MKRSTCIALATFVCLKIFAQQNFSGTLLDSATKNPIEFANVGIVGKGMGTVSNERGEFDLLVPDSLRNRQVKISILGYQPKVFSASGGKRGVIYLVAGSTVLNEVVVSGKKTRIRIIGNDTKTKRVQAGFKKNSLGAELAIKLDIKKQQTQLRKFFVNINANKLGLPIFRFNLYNVDEKGLPKENILKKNILIEPKTATGLVELDLLPYDIYVDDDVFIAIEWIKDLGDVSGLSFSTKLVGSTTYYRLASQDKWQKATPIGIGLHAEVAY